MKITTNIYFLLFLMILNAEYNTASAQSHKIKPDIVKGIIKANQSILDSVNQLIVVYNTFSTDTNAVLVALEKKRHNKWIVKRKPFEVGIGRNGFAFPNEKIEGDGKSPTGLFQLGQLFCYEAKVRTKLPYIQATKEDKWIDDVNSTDYNKYIRGETSATSFEKLLLRSNAYKYCVVIKYNTHPVVKGKGSAIFFHLGKGATSGCIVIDEKNMKKILKWLSPQKNPCILMGNRDELMRGF